METQRFDLLATHLAHSQTRRSAVRLLGLALLGGSGFALAAQSGDAKHASPKRHHEHSHPSGRKQDRRKHGGGGGGEAPVAPPAPTCDPACAFNQVCQDGACVAAANVCPAAFDCPDPFGGPAPVCGTVAGDNGACGCITTTEGNNVCVNQTDGNGNDIDASTLQTCASSQDCRDTVGFHFYCAAVTRSPSGKVCGSSVPRCWPECDNPA
jgi:hypothetical protein